MPLYRVIVLLYLLAVVLSLPAGEHHEQVKHQSRNDDQSPAQKIVATVASVTSGDMRSSRPATVRPITVAGPVSGKDILKELPLVFEENIGGSDGRFQYIARGAGYRIFLTRAEAIVSLRGGSRAGKTGFPDLRIKLVGASNDPGIEPVDKQPGRINYLIGNDPGKWRTGISAYGGVVYRQVYPGIDLHFYGNQRRLEYDFLITAGSDPGQIKVAFREAKSLKLDEAGDLLLTLAGGVLRQHKPIIYQNDNGKKRYVEGRYVINQDNQVTFAIDEYDKSLDLVIDPVLSYASYLGGGNDDQGTGIAVDKDGDIYVTGFTAATNDPTLAGIDGFPVAGALQSSNAGFNDLFVTRFKPGVGGAASVVYSTFLGGADDDRASSIALDAAGNIYLAGQTTSTDFPIIGGVQKAFGSSAIFKLTGGSGNWSPSGRGLSSNDIKALVVKPDDRNQIFAATANNGVFRSDDGGSSWKAVNGTVNQNEQERNTLLGSSEVRALAFGPTVLLAGTSRGVFRSYDGGTTWMKPEFEIPQDAARQEIVTAGEDVRSLAVDPVDSSMVFIGTGRGIFKSLDGGIKSAPGSNGLPNIDNATGLSSTEVRALLIPPSSTGMMVVAGTSDGVFVSSNAGAMWTSKNSGLANTDVRALAATSTGALLAGTAGGVFRSEDKGETWIRVANGAVRALTVVAGAAYAATVDSVIVSSDDGKTWMPSNTGQTGINLNALASGADGAIYLGARGATDGFLARLSNDGKTLRYSTFLGGGSSDQANALAVDSAGKVFLTGATSSINFPLKGATEKVEGGNDAFVVKIDTAVTNSSSLLVAKLLGGSGSDQGNGIAIDAMGNIYVTGGASSATFRGTTGLNGFQLTNGNTAIFRSGDSASTWNRFGAGLTGDQADAIAIDPKTPTTIYAGNASGLFKRTQSDTAWVHKTGAPENVRAIVIDPVDPKIVYLGSEQGIFKSIDSGGTWQSASSGLLSRSVQTLKIDPADPKTLYAGMSFGGLYKSINSGASWQLSNGPAGDTCTECLPGTTSSSGRSSTNVKSLVVVSGSGQNPSSIYAGLNGGVYKSADSGSKWQRLNGKVSGDNDVPCQTCLPQTNPENGNSAAQVDVVVVDPKNAATIYAAVNGVGLFKSVDGGLTWKASNNGLPNIDPETGGTTTQIRALGIDQSNPMILYLGSAGGLFKSSDGGASWQGSGKALTTSVVSALALDPADAKILYAGSGSEAGDAFIARIKSDGTALDYFTFLGGGDGDNGNGIVVTAAGAVLVTGQTTSFNFPVSSDARQKVQAGRGDAFMARLDVSKTGAESLSYSTYHGGSDGNDVATSIAYDSQGNLYLAGVTSSSNFPLRNAINAALNGSSDAFVSVLNPAGSDLVYSTYLGGSGRDAAAGIVVDGSRAGIVTGVTFSVDFPISLDPFDSTIGMKSVRPNPFEPETEMQPGGSDAFVARMTGAADAADLAITMKSSGTFRIGEVVNYDLTVTNAQGGSIAAPPLRIVDQLPDSLSFVSFAGNGWMCGTAGSAVTCVNSNPLSAGSMTTLRLNLRINQAPKDGQLTNSAAIYSQTSDPKPENNTARQTVTTIAPACPFKITPNTLNFTQEGGTGSIAVETDSGCGWTAEAGQNASFIMLDDVGGTGSGTIGITVAPNPTSRTRTGSLTVAGHTVMITQSGIACQPQFTPATQSIDAAGGTGRIDVTLPADCEWTAVSDDPAFLTVTAGTNGNGSGRVEYRVAAHEGIADRIGTLTIAGQAFRITQKGVVCTYTISPNSQTFGFDGGSGSITVIAPKSCAWSVTNANPNFIVIRPDGLVDGAGTGTGSIKFDVLKNTVAARRSGKILIADLIFNINQDALGCSFTIDPLMSRRFDARGGDGTVKVTASQDICAWNVTGADFVTVLSDESQTGTAYALFRVESNRTTSPRKTVISVAGRDFEVNQNGQNAQLPVCDYTITIPPSGQTFPAAGGSATIWLTAPQGCAWKASVDDASMVSFGGNDQGSGNGLIDFSVSVNSTSSSRVGLITIAGQTVVIRQDGSLSGAPCSFILTQGKTFFDAGGGEGAIIVNASQTTCEWTAASNADFLRIRNDMRIQQPLRFGSLTQTTTAYIVFDLMPNNRAADRTATLTIAGQRVTIRQAGLQPATPLRSSRRANRKP